MPLGGSHFYSYAGFFKIRFSPETYWMLAKHRDVGVRRLTACNPYCPEGPLDLLACDSHPFVRLGVSSNLAASEALVLRLLEDSDKSVRLSAIAHPKCPEGVLVSCFIDGSQILLSSVVENPRCPRYIFESVLRNEDLEDLFCSIGTNPGCPEDLMWLIYRNLDPGDRSFLGRNRNCPLKLFQKLAKGVKSERKNVGANLNCPDFLFPDLSRDRDYTVREAVAKNPNCPDDVIDHLRNDESPLVRRSAEFQAFKRQIKKGVSPDFHLIVDSVETPSQAYQLLLLPDICRVVSDFSAIKKDVPRSVIDLALACNSTSPLPLLKEIAATGSSSCLEILVNHPNADNDLRVMVARRLLADEDAQNTSSGAFVRI